MTNPNKYFILHSDIESSYFIFQGTTATLAAIKNKGYNENHVCNISNFSKIHHQAERKFN